jgi:flavodoxin
MKIAIVSYSMTGNNEALAAGIAGIFSAEHIKIREPKVRKPGRIFGDILFNRTPTVLPEPETLAAYDMVLFAGPVWMGQIATPLRPYLSFLKKNPRKYAFISISGGALGPNQKLARELEKRTGRKPDAVIDKHIADLLPPDPKPTMKDTSGYRITGVDIKRLTGTVVTIVEKTLALDKSTV